MPCFIAAMFTGHVLEARSVVDSTHRLLISES